MRGYDPSWRALLRPSSASDFFAHGRPVDDATLCAELSRIAYIGFNRHEVEEQRVRAILSRVGFGDVKFISAGGTECFIARDHAAPLTVVSFRGTSGFRDVLTDLMTWRTAWGPGGAVHAGFALGLRRVWPQLLQSLTHRNGRLLFTGHSRGAALAALAATLLPPDAVYAYGCPRVGNAQFAALAAAVDIVRTRGCTDLVCEVPPAWLGFADIGTERYVDRNGRLHAEPHRSLVNADQQIARREYLRRTAWKAGNAWSRRLADHAPANYLSAVRAASAHGSDNADVVRRDDSTG